MNSGQNLENIKKFIRAANYLTVSQIFLQDNFLLERPLTFEDIKPRLLGHWGSCPGVNHVYAHLLNMQKQLDFAKSDLKTAFMLGPGHAFPALQANLFLEETLSKFDINAARNRSGIQYISKNFSWPGGFPSHASPFTPGVILEGGELGYSLSTAFGAILDNPNLVITTLIGDGEAETGTIAASWHLNKLIDPVENGVVLPILHLNGYKISGPTIFGSMSDFELIQFFHGAGWEPKIVDEYSAEDFDLELSNAFSNAFRDISRIKFGRNNKFIRLPMIIMRSKKGSSGVKENNGQKIEGNSLAHQVPLLKAKTDKNELKKLENIDEYKIIIARGMSAKLLKEKFPQKSIIEIPINGYDVMNAVLRAEKEFKSKKIGVFLPNISIHNDEILSKAFGIDIKIFVTPLGKDIDFTKAADEGIDTVVGGYTAVAEGKKVGFNTTLIWTGAEAIYSAFLEMMRHMETINNEEKRNKTYQTILKESEDGIIYVDENKVIEIINRKAIQLLETEAHILGGEKIKTVFPYLEKMLDKTMKEQLHIHNELMRVGKICFRLILSLCL